MSMAIDKPLLSVRGLTKTFRQKKGLLGGPAHLVRAVDDVSLKIPNGSTVGLVGESGSGKSTLGRCLIRLTNADAGTITWNDSDGSATDITTLKGEELRAFRPRMQIVFQDPYNSLNPMRPVWQVIGEGLFIQGGLSRGNIRDRASEIAHSVGLTPEHLDRRPHEFSGGQRQRIAIARSLIMEPSFLVCDEVTSALDTRTQAQVLELLAELKQRTGITLLFISHDLHTVAKLSDTVAVMRNGRIVEDGSPVDLFTRPAEEYTRTLVAAVPNPNPRKRSFREGPAQ